MHWLRRLAFITSLNLDDHSEKDALRAEENGWLQLAAAGDKQAFSRLYDSLSRPLYSLCLTMLRNEDLAAEALQTAMLRIWQRASQFNPQLGSAFSWSCTITRRCVVDLIRQTGRTQTLLESFQKEPEASFESAISQEETNHRASRLRRALSELPPEQKTVVELAFLRGMTHREIESHLGEALGTVKARIRRGLLKLRDSLEKEAP